MTLSLDERKKLALSKILPVLSEYQLEMGTQHYLKRDATGANNLLEFIQSEIIWIDKATPVAPAVPTPDLMDTATPIAPESGKSGD